MKPLGALVLMRRDGRHEHKKAAGTDGCACTIYVKRGKKMKKTAKAIAAVVMATAMTVPAFAAGITEAQAREIALKKAGVSEDDVCYMTVSEDYGDGRQEYDVEFCVGIIAYSCSVDAATGAVNGFYVSF